MQLEKHQLFINWNWVKSFTPSQPLASTLRKSNTKNFQWLYGMLEAKQRSGSCGDITPKEATLWSTWSTLVTWIGSKRQKKTCMLSLSRPAWIKFQSSFSQIKVIVESYQPKKSHRNSTYRSWTWIGMYNHVAPLMVMDSMKGLNG